MSQKYVVYTFSSFLVTLSTIKGLTIVFSSQTSAWRRSRSATTDRLSLTKRTTAYLSRTRVRRRRLTSPLLDGHRSYCVSTKSTTSYADCLRVKTWHAACIMAVHGMYRWQRVFVALTCENSSYPRTRTRGSLQRPASLYVCTSGRRSSRLRISYIMTIRLWQTLRRVSSTRTTALHRTVRSAIRIRLRFR